MGGATGNDSSNGAGQKVLCGIQLDGPSLLAQLVDALLNLLLNALGGSVQRRSDPETW